MYKVIKYFTDLKDGNHPYNVGDDFPREGVKVDEDRIAELSSSKNKRREPLIAVKVVEKEPEKKGDANEQSGAAGNAKSKPRKKK